MHSLVANLRAILPYWWVLVVGGALAVSDLYNWHRPEGKEFRIPHSWRLTISVAAIVLAQFLAYRDQGENLAKVIDEKRELSIQNDTLRRQRDSENSENARLTDENARLKAQIPSETSLKARAVRTADDYEKFWRTRPKTPECLQTSQMTPEEQRTAMAPCNAWQFKIMQEYSERFAPTIMAMVEEFRAKGINVRDIENCAPSGFCGIAISVQLRAMAARLDASDNVKR